LFYQSAKTETQYTFANSEFKKKLEIWGKAQRESARRPSPIGGFIQVVEISPAAKSRGSKSNALAYAERALST